MTIPADPVAVPDRVRDLAHGAALECVWLNDIGGLTFRATPAAGDVFFIKWGPRNAETSLRDEAERMTWAGRFIRVPRVLDQGDDDTHEWLVTAAIDGESAVAPRWVAEPAVAVRAVGEGLRMLHDRLPASECPWDWGVPSRIANAAGRGIRVPEHLREAPPVERLVVCHADACCPNTLIGDDGRVLAHVDLAALGTADRWADIAVASMSTEWNYGPGWEDALIEAYGVEPDRERLAYYRDLWNAT
ncbi:aminoglycoside 3'-phosphotransferase [Microbacterium bovistercoris]|uniref:Aminoglycoside 3'-phosphotransferase n=1 Tax=Microbacterium bovistercoris TaxID=2293570 RepID=A0A371NNW3_9MICO|nr:aminoglycoside 3'-phosphotransferase [Microbacterium bovistercoris]REJ03850.1 aminoglycoside 3'-phosphotransferase [Microbacterium bovistercoris]